MFTKGKSKEAEPGTSSSTPTRLFELEDRAGLGETQITTSPKRLARIAGVLYLLVIGVKTVKPDERILEVE